MNKTHNPKSYILKQNSKVFEAVEILQHNPLKVVAIIDQKNKLCGSITDGDVRRGLLNGKTLDSTCSEIMNKKPCHAPQDDHKKIQNIINDKDIDNPILVNQKKEIIAIYNGSKHTMVNSKLNKIFIMAGGEGKRLLPLTLDTPKPMLMINDKPIIDIIISRFVEFGFSDINISVRYKSAQLINYFKNHKNTNLDIKFYEEKKPLGTAGSLSLLNKSDLKEPVIVINGDILTKVDFHQLLHFHKKSKSMITLCAAEYITSIPFGIMNLKKGKLINITEKPVNKNLINAGIYVVDPLIIRKMKKNVRIDMTSLIEEHMGKSAISVFPLHETWVDIGNKDDYFNAQKISYKQSD